MATPTEKNPVIDDLLDVLSGTVNPMGAGRRTSIVNDVCVFCNGPAVEFTDEVSRKEFTISGMCQTCQNETFGDE